MTKKVSVFMITYNHGPFIGQAIESIMSQKTDFDFELVIGEDFSTDNTLAICRQYAEKYPLKIKLLPSDRNIGMMLNTIRTLEACTGEYIAFCEGDDYWIDEFKLQKQVDFLEANPDYSMCFSSTEIVDELGWQQPDEKYFPIIEKDTLTIEDIILSHVSLIPTATMLVRNVLPKPLPEFYYHTFSGDLFLQLLAADAGKIKYFNTRLAAYRNHSGGITKSPAQVERTNSTIQKFYLDVNQYFNYRYDLLIRQRLFEMAKGSLIYGSREKKGLDKLKHYFKTMPKYLRYSKGLNFKEIGYYHLILFFPSLLKLFKKKRK